MNLLYVSTMAGKGTIMWVFDPNALHCPVIQCRQKKKAGSHRFVVMPSHNNGVLVYSEIQIPSLLFLQIILIYHVAVFYPAHSDCAYVGDSSGWNSSKIVVCKNHVIFFFLLHCKNGIKKVKKPCIKEISLIFPKRK